jgi:TonB-linked SusC/RagA family outer membrane protein
MKKNCDCATEKRVAWCKRNLFLKMRLTGFILLLAMFQGMATESYSQKTKVYLNLKNTSLREVLKTIEENTEFFFMYSSKMIDVDQKLEEVNINGKRIFETLDEVLKETGIGYTVNGRQILLLNLNYQEKTTNQEEQQPGGVSGSVTDVRRNPIPGVTVTVKGTSQGTITDINGNYTLSNVPPGAILVFSFVGMKKQEIAVTGKASIHMTLEEEPIGIEEVVAIGYGFQKKANLTGAVDQVRIDEVLRSRPVSNLGIVLQGTLPGVEINTSSGRPGESTAINIRGIESINGGDPLILVDNVPMDIYDLNPADIESISVLKDASASSIYGGRAAFGVILITTKKGLREQPMKINYTCNFTSSHASNLPEKASIMETISAFKAWGNTQYQTGQDLTTWENLLIEYQANPSKYPNGETTVNGVIYPLVENDIYGSFMQNSFEQMHNFSFSGGSDKADYRVSFGYSHEDGVMITDKDSYQKYSLSAYLNANLTKKLTSAINIFYKNDKRLTPANYTGLFTLGLRAPSFTDTGYYTHSDGNQYPWGTPNNYLELEPANPNWTDDIRIFEKLEYSFTKGLKLTAEYTFNKSNSGGTTSASGNTYMSIITPVPTKFGDPNYYQRSNSDSQYHALNIYANYQKEFKEQRFNIIVGTNQEVSKYSYFYARREKLLDKNNPSLATALGTMNNGESFSDYAISGFFSRLNYSYKDKYLFEANVRYDGSSKFPDNNRYGFFPSFSAGYVLSEEKFMKPVEDIVSFLKIRGAWGEIGNQSISNYAYIPGMATSNARWVDPATKNLFLTIGPPPLVSASFTWETVITKNIGININFLNNRLNTSFDYFNRKTLNMLGPGAELPAVIGASAPQQNVADLVSKGWELQIDWKETKGDFSYSLGLNLSDNRGFITKYNNKGGLLSQYYNGYEFGQIWGYVTDGFYTVDDFIDGSLDANLLNGTLKEGIPKFYTVINQNPGDIRFVDLNNDGIISPGMNSLSYPGDQKIIGNSNKRYQFGIIGNCSYKSFDLSFLIQGVGKCDFWPIVTSSADLNTNMIFWPYEDVYSSLYKNQLDYWTPENTDAYYMRSYKGGGGNANKSRRVQTKYLQNGAYIRLKNIELGYTLPTPIVERLFLSHARIFLSAENLWKFDHLPAGMDLEVTGSASNGGVYPYYKKISFGLNVSF